MIRISFWEARVEDPGFQAQMAAAQRMVQQAAAQASMNQGVNTTESTSVPTATTTTAV